MNIYRLSGKAGGTFAFEIDNAYIRPPKIALLLSSMGEVSDIHTRKIFSSSADIHVEFKYQGKDFIVWEPYGDNSRYWIGPKKENESVDISQLESVFENYQPPTAVKIFGDLITLNFKSLLKITKT